MLWVVSQLSAWQVDPLHNSTLESSAVLGIFMKALKIDLTRFLTMLTLFCDALAAACLHVDGLLRLPRFAQQPSWTALWSSQHTGQLLGKQKKHTAAGQTIRQASVAVFCPSTCTVTYVPAALRLAALSVRPSCRHGVLLSNAAYHKPSSRCYLPNNEGAPLGCELCAHRGSACCCSFAGARAVCE